MDLALRLESTGKFAEADLVLSIGTAIDPQELDHFVIAFRIFFWRLVTNAGSLIDDETFVVLATGHVLLERLEALSDVVRSMRQIGC
jgi:hypothetical protein